MDESTFSIADTKEAAKHITVESILDTYHQFLNENPVVVKEVRCAPDTFKKLNKVFEDEQAEREREGIKAIPPEQVWLSTLYGMKVVVDPEMKPGTWKFEYDPPLPPITLTTP